MHVSIHPSINPSIHLSTLDILPVHHRAHTSGPWVDPNWVGTRSNLRSPAVTRWQLNFGNYSAKEGWSYVFVSVCGLVGLQNSLLYHRVVGSGQFIKSIGWMRVIYIWTGEPLAHNVHSLGQSIFQLTKTMHILGLSTYFPHHSFPTCTSSGQFVLQSIFQSTIYYIVFLFTCSGGFILCF